PDSELRIQLEELQHQSMEPDAEYRPWPIFSMWSGRTDDPKHLGVDPVPERAPLGECPDGVEELQNGQGLPDPVAEDRHQSSKRLLPLFVDGVIGLHERGENPLV